MTIAAGSYIRNWLIGKDKKVKRPSGSHAFREDRIRLLMDITVTPATGEAEREAAKEMLARQASRPVKHKNP